MSEEYISIEDWLIQFAKERGMQVNVIELLGIYHLFDKNGELLTFDSNWRGIANYIEYCAMIGYVVDQLLQEDSINS